MKICNYYRHGACEKHYDGSFTLYGTIEGITDELFKMRYYGTNISIAIKDFNQKLKDKAAQVSVFINQD